MKSVSKNLSKLVSISYLDNDNYNNPYVSFKKLKTIKKFNMFSWRTVWIYKQKLFKRNFK